MPESRVRSDYENLQVIARQFSQQADECRAMLSNIRSRMEKLRAGDWYGKGADKFYAEMDSAVLPALNRLVNAMQEGSSVTNKASRIMKQAETDAAQLFRAALGGGSSGALGSAIGAAVSSAVSAVGAQLGQVTGANAAGIGGQLGAAIGSALSSAAAGGIGGALGGAIASSIAAIMTGGEGPADIGSMIGAAVAASNQIPGIGTELGTALGTAIRGALGQGSVSGADIGAAVAKSLLSGNFLGPLEADGVPSVGSALSTLLGTMIPVSGANTGAGGFSLTDLAVTPSTAGPIPIPYPNVQMGQGIGSALGDMLNGGNISDFGSSMLQSLGFSAEGTSKIANDMKSALESTGNSNEMVMLNAQQAQKQASETAQRLSNIMKSLHDTRKAIIANLRA